MAAVCIDKREAGQGMAAGRTYCDGEMLAKVVVHPRAEDASEDFPTYEDWLVDASNFLDKYPPDVAGQMLYEQRGCKQCHSVDGSPGIGPSFLGKFGSQEAMLTGETVLVEENYIRESILNPQARIVAGYDTVMPTYQGRLKDPEIMAIIEYLKAPEGAPQEE